MHELPELALHARQTLPPEINNSGDMLSLHGHYTQGIQISILPGDTDLSDTNAGMARILLRDCHWCKDEGGRLYYYKDGLYRERGEDFLNEVIVDYYTIRDKSKRISGRTFKEVEFILKSKVPILPPTPSIRYINLLNGIYDTKYDKLYKHTPKLITTVQLPIAYDPNAECPVWDKFVSEVFSDDCQQTPWEIIAWLMIPYVEIKKIILLLGDGNNGKSIFLHGLQEFLGEANYSHVPLHDLVVDKFSVSRLRGKLANICGEISAKQLPSTDKIKSLTGGDSIDAERKYSDRFMFKPFARHIYSANQLFTTNDKSAGFYNRCCIVPFPNQFTENPSLGNKLKKQLAAPQELSGVFNKAIKHLQRIKTNGITQTHTMVDALEKYQATDNTALKFIRTHLVEKKGIELAFSIIYDWYKDYCYVKKLDAMDRRIFGRELKKFRPAWKERRISTGERFYSGVDAVGISALLGLKEKMVRSSAT